MRKPTNELARGLTRMGCEVGVGTLVRRGRLADLLSRSPQSVSDLARQLKEAQVLRSEEREHGGNKHLELHPDLYRLAAVELRQDEAHIVLTDPSYRVLARLEPLALRNFESDPDDVIDTVALALVGMLRNAGIGREDRLAVGMSIPAPVDIRRKATASQQILPDWYAKDVVNWLRNRLDESGFAAHTMFHNDATLGALGTQVLRVIASPGPAPSPLVYVRADYGIGAGVAVANAIVNGFQGLAGEIGHFKMDERGPLCPRCGGVGCLETIASATAVVAKVLPAVPELGSTASIDSVIASPHPAAGRALRDAGWQVGRALSYVCLVLNPAEIAIGGALAKSDAFLRHVKRALARDAWPVRAPEVVRAPADGALSPELAGALAHASRGILRAAVERRVEAYVAARRER